MASLGRPAGNSPPSSFPRIIRLLVVKETADNFQFASLPLELYRDVLETPYSFLLPSQGTWENLARFVGRAWERGAGQACTWRDRREVSLGLASSMDLKCPASSPSPVQTDTCWVQTRPSSPTRPSATETCPPGGSLVPSCSGEEPGTFSGEELQPFLSSYH